MADQAEYGINQHKHTYACWTAARAYGRNLAGGGNQQARELIDAVSLSKVVSPDDLGDDVSAWLLDKMQGIVDYAEKKGITGITFGRAQKLVNIYFKTTFVCGGHVDHPKVAKLHPPLDWQLIKTLKPLFRANTGDGAYAALLAAQKKCSGWTAFNRDDYVAHINAIQMFLGDRPMWMIEQHWSPHD